MTETERDGGVRTGLGTTPPSLRPSLPPALPGMMAPGPLSARSLSTAQTLASAARRVEMTELIKQINEIGLRSLLFLCVTLGFVGAILVYQAGIQALRIVPDTSTVGASYLELLVRDLAASVTGLMLSTRVGAAIAAEIGSMKVTDQLDALRLCQTDPIDYLIAPKILASFIVTPLLTLIAGIVATFTGALTGYFSFGINPSVFLDPKYIDVGDLLTGISKAVVFGLVIPIISSRAGLRTKTGAEGVGDATTSAVVGSSLAVIVLGFMIGVAGQLSFG
ncbi:MAG TPA: ABC transporter permease [Polyangiaceae bacterium]|nr:ABC transporter permease [Polyangiaceae bacterium]